MKHAVSDPNDESAAKPTKNIGISYRSVFLMNTVDNTNTMNAVSNILIATGFPPKRSQPSRREKREMRVPHDSVEPQNKL